MYEETLMKTFIYFSQGEWRTFQAEELPVKPREPIHLENKSHNERPDYYLDLERYEFEIAALKAKSLKVGNPETIRDPRIMLKIFDHAVIDERDVFYEWPGTVEVQEEMYCTNPPRPVPNGLKRAFLKLPDTSKPIT